MESDRIVCGRLPGFHVRNRMAVSSVPVARPMHFRKFEQSARLAARILHESMLAASRPNLNTVRLQRPAVLFLSPHGLRAQALFPFPRLGSTAFASGLMMAMDSGRRRTTWTMHGNRDVIHFEASLHSIRVMVCSPKAPMPVPTMHAIQESPCHPAWPGEASCKCPAWIKPARARH